MKIERVTYQKVFPLGQYVNEKIGVDYLLNELDDPKAALQAAKDLCEEFHRESNNWPHPITEETIVPDIKVEKSTSRSLEDIIGGCTELEGEDGLYSYRKISEMNPKLKTIYNKTLKQLTK